MGLRGNISLSSRGPSCHVCSCPVGLRLSSGFVSLEFTCYDHPKVKDSVPLPPFFFLLISYMCVHLAVAYSYSGSNEVRLIKDI